MFSSLRLACVLVRIPHLALSLFLFPLLISLALVGVQLIVTGIVLKQVNSSPAAFAAAAQRRNDDNVVRWMLYGSGAPLPEPLVCRWVADQNGVEQPPSPACSPDRLDIAVRVDNPAEYDVGAYTALFNGQTERIHVCRSCKPDVLIEPKEGGKTVSQAFSFFGLMVLFLPYTSPHIEQSRVVVRTALDDVGKRLGDVSFFVPEIDQGIGFTALKGILPIVFHVSLLVVIALWLALRAHRRVLDYFSRNDVLLPLAAACGKQRFYSAIWLLTVLRVGCFLVMSIPVVYLGLVDVIDEKAWEAVRLTPLDGVMWILALVATMALATVIGSISELRHRHSLVSFTYKFVPFLAAVLGAAIWSFSFLLLSDGAGTVRLLLSAIPVVGIAPVLVAPATQLPVVWLGVHALLAVSAFIFILRQNSRWFAAHLEEV